MEIPLTPMDFARRARKLYAQREAVVDGKLRLNYEQFFRRCDAASAALSKLGVGKGDRVATIAPNTAAHLEQFYAVPQLGAVIVPLNYRLIAEDFVYLINHSGARVVCAHSVYLDTIDGIRSRCPTVENFIALEGEKRGWLNYATLLTGSDGNFPSGEIAENDLLAINYTSGTTSRPKGVMITHRNAWMNSIGTLLHHPMSAADRYLWTLPMFHANGWTFVWTVTAAGATHVCLRKVESAAVYELIGRERITTFCAAPTVLIGVANASEAIRRDAPSGLRVMTAGAPPAAATIERLEKDLGWTINHTYGLTETAPFITINEPRPEFVSLTPQQGAIQKARQGVELITSGELRVLDENGRDVPCDGATLGEIVARGNVVMAGYYKDPEATAEAIVDGWFHSGDAAVVHPDGYVEIRDRFKDVIISGGENISSVEVEGVLLRHPAVEEAAVVGLPHEKWGEAPHAFIVLRPGVAAGEEEIHKFVRAHLAGFKAPKGYRFVTELPKTATGKIKKYILRGTQSGISSV